MLTQSESASSASPVQSDTSSTSSKGVAKKIKSSVLNDKGEVDLEFPYLLLIVVMFKDMCPDQLFKPGGCDDLECYHLTHEMPGIDHLTKRLQQVNYEDAFNGYKLVATKFPQKFRDQFMPAFIEFFAEKKLQRHLKELIVDTQRLSPEFDFNSIVDAMLRNRWTRKAAVRFIVDNHEDSPQARNAIIKLIGTTGIDVTHFVDYLLKFKENETKLCFT